MTSASEQTSASKREPGYYWVTVGIFETIAEWVPDNGPRGGYWAQPRGTGVFDSDMHEIDERRIERPSPQQPPDTLSFDEACKVVAQKHGLGSTLVTGHRVQYFKEAHELAKGQPDELSKAQERIKELEVLLLHETGKNLKYQHALQNIANGSMPVDDALALDEKRRIAWDALNPKKP